MPIQDSRSRIKGKNARKRVGMWFSKSSSARYCLVRYKKRPVQPRSAHMGCSALGGGGGTSSFVLPAIILPRPIPTPSMTARRTAQPMAPLRMALAPPRTARAPPVKKPAVMAFQGSSFWRTPLTAQSNELNRPPQTPKFPPRTGARILMAVMAPERRSP